MGVGSRGHGLFLPDICCLCYFSVAMTKHHDQRNLIKKTLIGLGVSEGWRPWWQYKGSEAETAESSHLDLQTRVRENSGANLLKPQS